jgi:hypothetical protein
MRINPAIGIAIGVAVLIVGLVAHMVVLDITGAFVAVLSIGRVLASRGSNSGYRR